MLSELIKAGDRIELQAVEHTEDGETVTRKKVYQSKVCEILTEDTLEITIPMEKTKLVLLPTDLEYDMVFYAENNNLYQCLARIIDRYKSNNVYMQVMELTSNLRRYQRREYYRFSCALEMGARSLQEEEITAIDQNMPYALTPGLPLKQSVIVDISGGGLRFVSSQRYEPESILYISYQLMKGEEQKKYEVVGKVLSAKELTNKPGAWEHRVQYYDIDEDIREEIIKYIFEEERRGRRKGRL